MKKMTDTGRYIDIFTLIISNNTNERLRIHCCLEPYIWIPEKAATRKNATHSEALVNNDYYPVTI